MHVVRCAGFLLALLLAAQAEGKAVLNFDNGEISPLLASSIEKSGAGQYTLHFSNPSVALEKVRNKLEAELKDFPQLKVTTKGRSIILDFKGPDTYLLKALSRIDAE
jgi:hypothetical protein